MCPWAPGASSISSEALAFCSLHMQVWTLSSGERWHSCDMKALSLYHMAVCQHLNSAVTPETKQITLTKTNRYGLALSCYWKAPGSRNLFMFRKLRSLVCDCVYRYSNSTGKSSIPKWGRCVRTREVAQKQKWMLHYDFWLCPWRCC